MSTPSPPTRTPVIQLIFAWAFVGIPLLWGVLQTLRNAMKLFH
jgi:hypothetical protein